MNIDATSFRHFQLPGRAGEFQRSRSTASLIRELGDNYEQYSALVRGEFTKAGGRPNPADFESMDDFLAAWGKIEEIVKTEALLRRARNFRLHRERLDTPLDTTVPLVDSDDRLMSIHGDRSK